MRATLDHLARRAQLVGFFGVLSGMLGLFGCAMTETPPVAGDVLEHRALHLVVTKPPAWRFLSPKEKFDARYAADFKNTGWGQIVKQNSFPPRIVIAKYPEPRVALNPSLSIDLYPFGREIMKDPLRAASWVLGDYNRFIFTPVTVVEPLQFRTVAGRQAGYFRIRFALELKNGPAREIDLRVWAITRGMSVYLIQAVDAQNGPDVSAAEIDATVLNLRFTN
jgi:hypothetical protein